MPFATSAGFGPIAAGSSLGQPWGGHQELNQASQLWDYLEEEGAEAPHH